MKPETMRTAFLVLFAMLTALFVAIAWPFAKAAFLAFTLAVIFYPLQRFAIEKFRLPRYIAAIGSTLIVGVCVVFPLVVLASVVVTQTGHFLQSISLQAEGGAFSNTLQPLLESLHGWLSRVTSEAPSIEDIRTAIFTVLKEAGKRFYEFSPRVLSTTVSIVANFFLMLVFLVVFFAEGGSLYDWFMETAPLSPEHRKELAHDVRLTITYAIIAALVTAIVQGILLGIGFWIAGFSHVASWGLIAVILSLIPVIGAASCYITATVVLLSAGNVKAAVLFIIYGAGIISTIDNVIRPIVMRGKANMHPLLLFVALVGAVRLLGPIGLLVGPVLLSIFLASLRIYRREFAGVGS